MKNLHTLFLWDIFTAKQKSQHHSHDKKNLPDWEGWWALEFTLINVYVNPTEYKKIKRDIQCKYSGL